MTARRRPRPARKPRPADYPALAAFLRGYLHEDSASEHADAEGALSGFLGEASPDERKALAGDSARFLAQASGASARDLPRLLAALGGAWEPEDGEEIRTLLARAAAAAEGPSEP